MRTTRGASPGDVLVDGPGQTRSGKGLVIAFVLALVAALFPAAVTSPSAVAQTTAGCTPGVSSDSIAGSVFQDTMGFQWVNDSGDVNLPGVTFQLRYTMYPPGTPLAQQDAAAAAGEWSPWITVTTGADGYYCVADLPGLALTAGGTLGSYIQFQPPERVTAPDGTLLQPLFVPNFGAPGQTQIDNVTGEATYIVSDYLRNVASTANISYTPVPTQVATTPTPTAASNNCFGGLISCGVISGVVGMERTGTYNTHDATDALAAGVEVCMQNITSDFVMCTTTDATGRYTFYGDAAHPWSELDRVTGWVNPPAGYRTAVSFFNQGTYNTLLNGGNSACGVNNCIQFGNTLGAVWTFAVAPDFIPAPTLDVAATLSCTTGSATATWSGLNPGTQTTYVLRVYDAATGTKVGADIPISGGSGSAAIPVPTANGTYNVTLIRIETVGTSIEYQSAVTDFVVQRPVCTTNPPVTFTQNNPTTYAVPNDGTITTTPGPVGPTTLTTTVTGTDGIPTVVEQPIDVVPQSTAVQSATTTVTITQNMSTTVGVPVGNTTVSVVPTSAPSATTATAVQTTGTDGVVTVSEQPVTVVPVPTAYTTNPTTTVVANPTVPTEIAIPGDGTATVVATAPTTVVTTVTGTDGIPTVIDQPVDVVNPVTTTNVATTIPIATSSVAVPIPGDGTATFIPTANTTIETTITGTDNVPTVIDQPVIVTTPSVTNTPTTIPVNTTAATEIAIPGDGTATITPSQNTTIVTTVTGADGVPTVIDQPVIVTTPIETTTPTTVTVTEGQTTTVTASPITTVITAPPVTEVTTSTIATTVTATLPPTTVTSTQPNTTVVVTQPAATVTTVVEVPVVIQPSTSLVTTTLPATTVTAAPSTTTVLVTLPNTTVPVTVPPVTQVTTTTVRETQVGATTTVVVEKPVVISPEPTTPGSGSLDLGSLGGNGNGSSGSSDGSGSLGGLLGSTGSTGGSLQDWLDKLFGSTGSTSGSNGNGGGNSSGSTGSLDSISVGGDGSSGSTSGSAGNTGSLALGSLGLGALAIGGIVWAINSGMIKLPPIMLPPGFVLPQIPGLNWGSLGILVPGTTTTTIAPQAPGPGIDNGRG